MKPRLQGIPTAIYTGGAVPRQERATREVLYAPQEEQKEAQPPQPERSVTGFYGYFSFLSLLEPAAVFYEDRLFPTAAHAFEAARAPDQQARTLILKAPTLQDMLEIASTNADPPNWDVRRLVVMEAIQRDKFKRNIDLREKLVSTAPRSLLHVLRPKKHSKRADDPTSRDGDFWGKRRGKKGTLQGQNQLGRILEKVRADILQNDGSELQQWLGVAFGLEEEISHIPIITFEVFKEHKLIETVKFQKKPIFVLGCQPDRVDYVIAHPSLSRQHAVLFVRRDGKGVFLVDIGSKAGSFVDKQQLKPYEPQRLRQGSKIAFGASTREYVVEIDFSRIESLLQAEKRMMERELNIMRHIEKVNHSDAAAVKEALDLAKEDTVFVGGLPSGVNQEEVKEIMSAFGEVLRVRMPEDPYTSRKRGFAFVEFASVSAAKKAILSDGMKLYERKLKIKVADKRIELKNKERRKQEDRRKRDWSSERPRAQKHHYKPLGDRSIGRYEGLQSSSPERERSRSAERARAIEEDFEDRVRVMARFQK